MKPLDYTIQEPLARSRNKMMNFKSFGSNAVLFSAGLLCLLSCKAIGQDVPGAAGTPGSTPPQPSSGSSIWTNPPKVINPATRDAQLEALPSAPTGDSVITAPATDMDQAAHTVVCTSIAGGQEVTVVGNDFRMRCQTLYVYFNKANKIDHMVADGNVVIEQPDRLTEAGHAVFLQVENKITLTDSPEIYDDGRHIKGTVITIYRGKNTMNVVNSIMIIPGSSATSPTTPTPAP